MLYIYLRYVERLTVVSGKFIRVYQHLGVRSRSSDMHYNKSYVYVLPFHAYALQRTKCTCIEIPS
jgi:hypothetical protein